MLIFGRFKNLSQHWEQDKGAGYWFDLWFGAPFLFEKTKSELFEAALDMPDIEPGLEVNRGCLDWGLDWYYKWGSYQSYFLFKCKCNLSTSTVFISLHHSQGSHEYLLCWLGSWGQLASTQNRPWSARDHTFTSSSADETALFCEICTL